MNRLVPRLRRRLAALLFLAVAFGASPARAADRLVILSSHRKSIQDEFLPKFKEWYQQSFATAVDVDWLDNGGTSDAMRLLRAKFDKHPETAGVDIFWGGGTAVFLELDHQKLLAPYVLPPPLAREVPEFVAGVPLFDKSRTWYASAMSSYGIFFNRKLLKLEALPTPTSWKDLADPRFLGKLSLADPRHSGTAMSMELIVLQAFGWQQGWELLTRIDANTRAFTHSSSDPIKAVVAGDAAASMAIDFYATPKVAELGADNLGFVLPKSETVLDPDPIAIVKGAPDRAAAERFVQFVLGTAGQKLWLLPKGAPDGPRLEALGRMAVNQAAYAQTEGRRTSAYDPFKQPTIMQLDVAKDARIERAFTDLVGATHIDTLPELRAAWEAVIKRGPKAAEVSELARPPVSEAELGALADKWDDSVLRNTTINAWVAFAKAKYQRLKSGG